MKCNDDRWVWKTEGDKEKTEKMDDCIDITACYGDKHRYLSKTLNVKNSISVRDLLTQLNQLLLVCVCFVFFFVFCFVLFFFWCLEIKTKGHKLLKYAQIFYEI